MKAVLLSVQPKWCELIANGEKTIEVRKTKPNLETPFKCYIYCTKEFYNSDYMPKNGRVIGEFVCDDIVFFGNIGDTSWDRLLGNVHEYHKSLVVNQALLTEEDMLSYGGKYGWHISDLVIYDKPKELSEFKKINRNCYFTIPDCEKCKETDCMVQKAPQSWRYVEELERA